MKSLQTIQTIVKIARVISKIVYICCIVGFCLCIVGVIGLALGAPTLKLGGVTLESLLSTNSDVSAGTLYVSAVTGAILCCGEGVLAWFAFRYFEKELADGTPFTRSGAGDLFRLGILSIGIPIAVQIVSRIVLAIFTQRFADVVPPDTDPAVSVSVGVLVLLIALLCKYGAENAEAASQMQS